MLLRSLDRHRSPGPAQTPRTSPKSACSTENVIHSMTVGMSSIGRPYAGAVDHKVNVVMSTGRLEVLVRLPLADPRFDDVAELGFLARSLGRRLRPLGQAIEVSAHPLELGDALG